MFCFPLGWMGQRPCEASITNGLLEDSTTPDFVVILAKHHPDASNVMGITGTYQLKCNGVWQHLNLSYRLRKAGKTLDAGVIPRPIDAQPNQASKFYDAYLFGQNLVGDKDQLEVCIFHQATNTNGYTEPEAHHCDFV
ncbi:MAG: hypothetical protein M1826_003335 [Phylliscum demangeonii]|nr:MAG: hypothetical protein M1826_003335 [Phylliscum demangeonii]